MLEFKGGLSKAKLTLILTGRSIGERDRGEEPALLKWEPCYPS